MNFAAFGGHFSTGLPPIGQFSAKFPHDVPTTTLSGHPQIISPSVTSTAIVDGARFTLPVAHLGSHATSTSMPISVPDAIKYSRSGNVTVQHTHQLQGLGLTALGSKYSLMPGSSMPTFARVTNEEALRNLGYGQENGVQHPATNQPTATRQGKKGFPPSEQDLQPQDLCETILKDSAARANAAKAQLEQEKDDNPSDRPTSEEGNQDSSSDNPPTTLSPVPWGALPAHNVTEYITRFPSNALSLHQFLKFSAESMKKVETQYLPTVPPTGGVEPLRLPKKKKKKKKKVKEKGPRPKPGEIQITTALDGTMLYCCPQCHVAYTDKDQLDQHMIGHKLERPHVCDICGARLKRKEHLDRHKQGHSDERPHVCTVCLKAFKRSEHLNRHFRIHSGDKKHVCAECGKAFSRRDHLNKHVHSHLTKRMKAEYAQQRGTPATPAVMS